MTDSAPTGAGQPAPPPRALAWRRRQDFRQAAGVLLVLRAPPPAPPPAPGQPPAVPADPAEGPELLLCLADDGHAVGLHGHVDLGTGIATALAQLLAEELDLPPERARMVLGDTARAPNQGPTIASSSLQIHARPLQQAAAQARAWLVAEAARALGLPPQRLHTADGAVRADDGRTRPYAQLVAAAGHTELMLDTTVALKPVAEHRLVGRSLPRVDLPAKLAAEPVYVHDVRLPGMWHGRVLRPPYAGMDAGDFVGRSLQAVEPASIAALPDVLPPVVIGDFVGVVAAREEVAEAAMRQLVLHWKPGTPSAVAAPLEDPGAAISAHPATPRVVADSGDVDARLAALAAEGGQRLDREYIWPWQLHASLGPSCAVALWHGPHTADHDDPGAAGPAAPAGSADEPDAHPADAGVGAPVDAADPADPSGGPAPALVATVWTGSQNPHVLRRDLARLVGVAEAAIEVVRLEASGCYGRNGADDVAADALLLARASGRPVRVQLTREQEHAWEPKGAAQRMTIRGGLDAQGRPAAYDFSTAYPSNGAPTLALLLTGVQPATAQAFEMGDRTSVPPYAYPAQRVTIHDMAPIVRASWLRGVSALPNSFAHESYIDELAHAAGQDPVQFRLGLMPDARAAELLRATADKAGWQPRNGPRRHAEGDWLQGQGVAWARYVHSRFPGYGAAWAAWVADVQVHRVTGELQVTRVVVGHDAGLMVNPLGVQQQVHGNVLQTTSRALVEQMPVEPGLAAPAPQPLPLAPRSGGATPALPEPFRPGTGSAAAAGAPVGPGAAPGRPDRAVGLPWWTGGAAAPQAGRRIAAREWGSYPILNFRQVPVVEVLLVPRPGEAPLGAGESASVPGTAAIANAIFDATGLRLRQPPFTPEVLRAALAAAEAGAPAGGAVAAAAAPGPVSAAAQGAAGAATGFAAEAFAAAAAASGARSAGAPEPADPAPGRARPAPPPAQADPLLPAHGRWRRAAGWLGASLGGGLLALAAWAGLRPAAIAPVQARTAGVYSEALIARGAELAALGNCVGCHAAPGTRAPDAGPDTRALVGGHALHTPFGTVYAGNLTPDAATGIGQWSFSAFQRAMREGLSRDGRHLYPAFPYTAFRLASDDDLQALYAWLMSRPAVAQATPPAQMRWPFNQRPLMALWNAWQPAAVRPVAEPAVTTAAATTAVAAPSAEPALPRDAAWWRGAQLVNGLGHCSACHSPRDALGVERNAEAYLAGALVDGWQAPPLGALARGPVPWTEAALVQYLRQGHHPRHGVAGGNMAPVVQALSRASERDVADMARYLVSLQPQRPDEAAAQALADRVVAAAQAAAPPPDALSRFFDSACGACHHGGDSLALVGLNQPLALNATLHADRPDNLLRTLVQGIQNPAFARLGHMPAFGHALSDAQLLPLAAWLRRRFAPDRPAWTELPAALARVRADTGIRAP